MDYTLLVIFFCAVIQSVFGIGLLVFGTPTLLLMGYSFPETLSLVLPAAVVVSGLQVYESRSIDREYLRLFSLKAVPWVLIFLSMVMYFEYKVNLKLPIGIILLVSSVLRISKAASAALKSLLTKHESLYLMITGIIHGLTNIGGGLVTLFVSTRYRGDKIKTREILGLTYLVLSTLQYLIVIIKYPAYLKMSTLINMGLAFLAAVFVGRLIFARINASVFDKVLTLFIFIYGVLMVAS